MTHTVVPDFQDNLLKVVVRRSYVVSRPILMTCSARTHIRRRWWTWKDKFMHSKAATSKTLRCMATSSEDGIDTSPTRSKQHWFNSLAGCIYFPQSRYTDDSFLYINWPGTPTVRLTGGTENSKKQRDSSASRLSHQLQYVKLFFI